jgi:glucosamine 6-phosphate synthetase-like amidotransferase/phosphosugar isomerase protein
VYTNGYTATLVACGLLADALTRAPAGASGAAADGSAVDGAAWDALPGLVERVLAASEAPVARAAARLTSARMLDFVGQREHLAAAGEGALLVREGARVPTSAMDTYQYLHGPMEPLEPGAGCVVLGDGREVELARAAAATGATALLITTADVDDGLDPGGNLVVLRLPKADPIQLAVLEALPIQLLTWRLARARGLAIEGFRYRQADTKLDG